MRLRQATTADIPAIIALGRQSPAAGHWSKRQYEDLLSASNFSASNKFRPSNEPHRAEACVLAVEAEDGVGEILGFLAARRIDAEWELENIVVAENHRRKGIGSLLLGELISYAQSAGGAAIFLEVRQSNESARDLYRKLGFKENGVRKNYYSSPAEDAILYRLLLEITAIS